MHATVDAPYGGDSGSASGSVLRTKSASTAADGVFGLELKPARCCQTERSRSSSSGSPNWGTPIWLDRVPSPPLCLATLLASANFSSSFCFSLFNIPVSLISAVHCAECFLLHVSSVEAAGGRWGSLSSLSLKRERERERVGAQKSIILTFCSLPPSLCVSFASPRAPSEERGAPFLSPPPPWQEQTKTIHFFSLHVLLPGFLRFSPGWLGRASRMGSQETEAEKIANMFLT